MPRQTPQAVVNAPASSTMPQILVTICRRWASRAAGSSTRGPQLALYDCRTPSRKGVDWSMGMNLASAGTKGTGSSSTAMRIGLL